MLGFLIAIGTELATNQSIWSQVRAAVGGCRAMRSSHSSLTPDRRLPSTPLQIAGKYVDRELVEQPIGASVFFFAFTVVALTFASYAPLVLGRGDAADKSAGPFTKAAELANGRAGEPCG